jgi:hypothetical protein
MGDTVPVPEDWSDRAAVKARLRTQPREVCVALAARAALRVLPLLPHTNSRFGIVENCAVVALPMFRAYCAGWTASIIAGTASAGLSKAVAAAANNVEYVCNNFAQASHAVDAACALTSIFMNSLMFEPIDHLYFVMIDDVLNYDKEFGRFAVEAAHADARAIVGKGNPKGFAEHPMWPDGIPDWFQAAWNDWRVIFLGSGENWEVWTDWYEARIRGGPVDMDLETKRVIGPKRWDEGPKAVNAEIAAIIADHRRERHSTVLARVAALEAEIASLRGASHGQIGHNGPPGSIDVESPDIAPALAELKATTASPDEPSLAAAAVRRLGRALSAILNWSAAKVDRFVDGCIDAGAVAAVGVVTVAGLPEWATGLMVRFGEVVEAVAAWLRSFGMAM